MLRTLALAALLLVTALPVSAGLKECSKAYYLDRNYRTAIRECKPLAEKGNADAQHIVGALHYFGMGVPKNDGEAAKWFRKAAMQGNGFSQFSLSLLYYRGKGVPRNLVKAYMWIKLAEENIRPIGEPNKRGGLTHLMKMRREFGRRMTPAEVAEAEEMAAKWKPKKAKPAE